tara:strand:+ start:839 stop:1354 length:516 start_codon:yes stop_codon:yes gene_type:complete
VNKKNNIRISPKLKYLFLDFDGVLTNNFVFTDSKGNEYIQSSKSDSIYVELYSKLGVKLIVISSEKNQNVKMRCKKMKLKCFNGISNKKTFLEKYINDNSIQINNCGYVGNDLNDFETLKMFPYRFCPSDSNPIIKRICNYRLKSKGGDYILREIFEYFFELNPNKLLNIE